MARGTRRQYFETALSAYLKEISKYSLLTPEEEKEIAKKSRIGNTEARNKLILANLRYVVKIAQEYLHRGLTFQELIDEGNMGLVEAASRFDERKNTRFTTYANWWIRYNIITALANRGLIKYPMNQKQLANKVKNMYLKLGQKLGREPAVEEVAEAMGVKVSDIKKSFLANQLEISLDGKAYQDSEILIQEIIENKEMSSPEEEYRKKDLRKRMDKILEFLSPKERDVIKLYYGIEDGEYHTLQEIGNKYNNSREAIRQIKMRALKKLKKNLRKKEWMELQDLIKA